MDKLTFEEVQVLKYRIQVQTAHSGGIDRRVTIFAGEPTPHQCAVCRGAWFVADNKESADDIAQDLRLYAQKACYAGESSEFEDYLESCRGKE